MNDLQSPTTTDALDADTLAWIATAQAEMKELHDRYPDLRFFNTSLDRFAVSMEFTPSDTADDSAPRRAYREEASITEHECGVLKLAMFEGEHHDEPWVSAGFEVFAGNPESTLRSIAVKAPKGDFYDELVQEAVYTADSVLIADETMN